MQFRRPVELASSYWPEDYIMILSGWDTIVMSKVDLKKQLVRQNQTNICISIHPPFPSKIKTPVSTLVKKIMEFQKQRGNFLR